MMGVLNTISVWVIPVMILSILILGLYKRVNLFEAFIEGAKDGLSNTVKILPALVGLLLAIAMFRASGAMDALIRWISPLTGLLHIPAEVMPLALMRPISGSGALAIVADNFNQFGPDSMIGRLSSVLMGSTETTFYTIAVYFGAVHVKKTRYTVPAALVADLTGLITGVLVCFLFFRTV